ncbi:uncharacterized protein SCHCODRAFT_02605742 [Schizophyllum commune H4-8]|uniref:uncharacterized protein n=1 Tax=Schizophyllum commune (strain H4-8 / FGSC 9210) TaxID=578458 RepID=UPI00215FF020|nr:uncharacterized protein SCHCODRAFT_02605742 [Schizophyllum commune H4-8]KAI5899650.1 hypothetical protein SCHCODRAFT_02605742 [Schizophyllum commune H4-8]
MLPLILLAAAAGAQAQSSATYPEGVLASGTMGPMNPPSATLGTELNQTSGARLVSINSVDDFCLFGPPDPNSVIGDTEAYEVAWCTQARNNARVIPDGTITGVSLLKTDMYVQIMGYGDLTKINIAPGDYGGELDPHGATGEGNPVGGNVTTNITTGSDLNYQEWMMYVSYEQFCFRICTNANSTYSTEYMCWHELDEMGCEFVMPGNYDINGTFETCEADVAYPPGWYPTATSDGTTLFSTFAQYYEGVYTSDGTPVSYTVGTTVTPDSVAFTPSSSNCQTVSTISNGIDIEAGTTKAGSDNSGSSTSGSGGSTTGTAGADSATTSGSNAGSRFVVDLGAMGAVGAVVIAALSGVAVFM